MTSALWLFLLVAVPLGASDARRGRLPNAGVVLFALCGLAVAYAEDPHLLLERIAAMLCLLLAGYLLRWCVRGRLGAGDVKLVAAVAAWGGIDLAIPALFWGALLAFGGALLRKGFTAKSFRNGSPLTTMSFLERRIVLGPWILVAAGCLLGLEEAVWI